METVTEEPADQVLAGQEPAFRARWDGWAVFWIFILLILLFYIVQLLATSVLIFAQYGHVIADYLRTNNQTALMDLFKTPEGLAKVFSPPNLFVIQLVSGSTLVLLTLAFARVLGAGWRALGLGRTTTARTVLIGIGAGLGLLLVSLVVESVQERIFGPHPQAIIKVFEHHHGILAFVLDLAAVAVIAPIAEELFFRGFLFTALVQRMSLPAAAVLSGLIFGLSHVELWSIVPLTVLGVGLAYVYYRTGNIWANITTHATINAVSLTLAFLFPKLGG